MVRKLNVKEMAVELTESCDQQRYTMNERQAHSSLFRVVCIGNDESRPQTMGRTERKKKSAFGENNQYLTGLEIDITPKRPEIPAWIILDALTMFPMQHKDWTLHPTTNQPHEDSAAVS